MRDVTVGDVTFGAGRRFVLATDGSPYADTATAVAGSLAKILDAPVSALSVTLPSQSAQRHEEARSAANRAAAFLASHGLTAEAETRHGRPDEAIVQTAVDRQADLIVVGSHGRHGLALLLGSTASSVVHHAKCDVLAVRLPEE